MSEPSRVLVLAPNWLGDAVMALPAIADVRRAFPSARLIAAARATVADVFRLAPAVDEVVTLGWTKRWWRRREMADAAAQLRALKADVAILLPNSFASAWLMKQAGVPERWGYRADLRGWLLSRVVPRPQGSRHQGEYYQHLTHALGLASGPLQPDLSVPPRATASARRLLVERGWDEARPLVVLAPGAAYGTAKRWLPSYVARLASDLVRDRGASCVLVGSRADAETTRLVREDVDPAAAPHVIDLAGETDIEALAGVLGLARACVSNDSGAMHLAAAIGAPLVAIFGPTRECETAPLTRADGRAEVLTNPVFCRPCMLRECPIDHRCMTRITPRQVKAAVERVMA